MRGGDRLYHAIHIRRRCRALADAVNLWASAQSPASASRWTRSAKGPDFPARSPLSTSSHTDPRSSRRAANGCASVITRSAAGSTAHREIFSTIPRTPLEIREVEAFRERNEAGGSYQDGSPDGTRPGIFYYNAYDLPSRRTSGMETLYLHEGSPGHHFQISLANENTDLPSFMRYGGNTAFVEGWALYAETLWDELGMETDPYQLRRPSKAKCARDAFVVDNGIHAKG